MSTRQHTIAVVTSGLIVAAGVNSGCQAVRGFRSEDKPRSRWQRVETHLPSNESSDESYRPETETYLPEQRNDSPSLYLPPEPESPTSSAPDQRPMPAPPAVEVPNPQARWRPSQPVRAPSPRYSSISQDDDANDFSPARVTYNASDENNEVEITPAQESANVPQPKLFKPAGTTKNMYDSMKRKFSR